MSRNLATYHSVQTTSSIELPSGTFCILQIHNLAGGFVGSFSGIGAGTGTFTFNSLHNRSHTASAAMSECTNVCPKPVKLDRDFWGIFCCCGVCFRGEKVWRGPFLENGYTNYGFPHSLFFFCWYGLGGLDCNRGGKVGGVAKRIIKQMEQHHVYVVESRVDWSGRALCVVDVPFALSPHSSRYMNL